MTNACFDDQGKLLVTSSKDSSSRDFDFYLGDWLIHNRRLQSRLSGCLDWDEFESTDRVEGFLQGLANHGHYSAQTNTKIFEGYTLRLFDPTTQLWSIYWADSEKGVLTVPQVGSFHGNIGHFYALDLYNGYPVLIQFVWDKTDPLKPVWSQAFSQDQGSTWEWNWYMYSTR